MVLIDTFTKQNIMRNINLDVNLNDIDSASIVDDGYIHVDYLSTLRSEYPYINELPKATDFSDIYRAFMDGRPKKEQCLVGAQMDMVIENIADKLNVYNAYQNAKVGKKSYKQIAKFEEFLNNNMHELQNAFTDGSYRTRPYTVKTINERGKERVIAIVPFRDRVGQWMIALWYNKYFKHFIHPNTYAAIPERGIHPALRKTEFYVRKKKYEYCLKFDIKQYFPSVNRTVLKMQMEQDVKDYRLLNIMRHIIDDAPLTGIPIGNYLSQFFANRYLTDFDYWLGERADFVRYMDDIVVFSHSKEHLHKLFREIEWYLKKNLYLDIKENWQIFPISARGIDFVGYRVWKHKTILRKSTFRRMRRKLRVCFRDSMMYAGFVIRCGCERYREKYDTEYEYNTFYKYTRIHDKGVIMSYLGWICGCTYDTRRHLFHKYFMDLIYNFKIELTRRLQIYVHYNQRTIWVQPSFKPDLCNGCNYCNRRTAH